MGDSGIAESNDIYWMRKQEILVPNDGKEFWIASAYSYDNNGNSSRGDVGKINAKH